MKHNKLQMKELDFVQSEVKAKGKSLNGSYVLSILLGFLGIHRAYLERLKSGIAKAILSFATIGVGLLVLFTSNNNIDASEANVAGSLLGFLFIAFLGVSIIWWVWDIFQVSKWVEEINVRNEEIAIEKAIQSRYVEEHILKNEIVDEVMSTIMDKVKITINQELDARQLHRKKKKGEDPDFPRLPSPALDITNLAGDLMGVNQRSSTETVVNLNKDILDKLSSENEKTEESRTNISKVDYKSLDIDMSNILKEEIELSSLEEIIMTQIADMINKTLDDLELEEFKEDLREKRKQEEQAEFSQYMSLNDTVDDSLLYIDLMDDKPPQDIIADKATEMTAVSVIPDVSTVETVVEPVVVKVDQKELTETVIEPLYSSEIDFVKVEDFAPIVIESTSKYTLSTHAGYSFKKKVDVEHIPAVIKIEQEALTEPDVEPLYGNKVEFIEVESFAPIVAKPVSKYSLKTKTGYSFKVENSNLEPINRAKNQELAIQEQFMTPELVEVNEVVEAVLVDERPFGLEEYDLEDTSRYANTDWNHLAAHKPINISGGRINSSNSDQFDYSGNLMKKKVNNNQEFIDIVEGRNQPANKSKLPAYEEIIKEQATITKTDWGSASLKPLYDKESKTKRAKNASKENFNNANIKVVDGIAIDKDKYEERKRRAEERALKAKAKAEAKAQEEREKTEAEAKKKKRGFFGRR